MSSRRSLRGGDGFLSMRLADAVARVEEGAVAGICRGCDVTVKDGELTDVGEDEDGSGSG